MAFDVYPSPQTKPLNIAAGASATTTLTTERLSAGSPPTMFIRVAIIASNVAPTFALQAGAGDSVVLVASSPNPAQIYDQPGGTGNNVADAYLAPQSNGVYLITVLRYTPPPLNQASFWKLKITNNDINPKDFTFVVADSDAPGAQGSQQPWMDLAAALPFEVLVTETGQFNVAVLNKGTGDLTGPGGAGSALTGTLSGPDAATFTFNAPATAVAPNSSLIVTLSMAAVNNPASLNATLNVASNDPTQQAAPSAGHNSVMAISGTVEQLEIGFALDASGSMAFSPGGSSIIKTAQNNTRYGMLKSAAEAALIALRNHVSGKGTFGVDMYPDITPFPANPNDNTYNGPFPVPSPSAADFSAAKPITVANINAVADTTQMPPCALEQHFTREYGAATPMGSGIAHAIGPSDGSKPWGYFSSDPTAVSLNRRWLILMTDGNHNSGEDPSDFYAGSGGFTAKNIQVAAIGYGNPNPDPGAAWIAPVDTNRLHDIINHSYKGTNSNYHFVNALDDPSLTVSFIKTLLLNSLQFDTTADPQGVLTSASPTVSRQVLISQYDRKLSFFVAWTTYDPQRLQVQVITPLGEVIEEQAPGVTVDFNPRFRMLTFDTDFLRNTKNPSKPRYGTWTLVLTLTEVIFQAPVRGAAAIDSETYNYQIFVDSRLRLRTQLNQSSYAPGDKVRIAALLTLDWLGIPNAAVTLAQVVPGASQTNWLATSPVTAAEYNQAAQAQAKNPDVNSLGIKSLALAAKGVQFTPVTNTAVLNMVDSQGTGTYVADLTGSTSVPGDYDFHITAVGSLSDGTVFRREQAVTIHVAVVPDPAYTVFNVGYAVVQVGNQSMIQATLTVRPLDRFGNVVLIDPNFDPSLVFTTTGGTFQGPIIDNHDGSYSRILTYPPGQSPGVGVVAGGTIVVPVVPVVDVSGLIFVDRVFAFRAGREAAPGANKHTDPQACLGNFTSKPSLQFVSLGGGGVLIVGYAHAVIKGQGGNDDITVFVQPDQDLRPYSVEVTTEDVDDEDEWTLIGKSSGVTQSFGLRQGSKALSARAIRIKDLSGRIRNTDGSPSATPGVSILAVGAKSTGKQGNGDDDDE